jgi:hypothetical protein
MLANRLFFLIKLINAKLTFCDFQEMQHMLTLLKARINIHFAHLFSLTIIFDITLINRNRNK